MPDIFYREPKKINLNERAKTERMTGIMRGFSPEGREKRWHRSLLEDAKAKNAAIQHSERVQDDTLKHLSQTVHLAGSIAGKGADINEELLRKKKPKLELQVFNDFDLLNGETGLASVSAILSRPQKPLYHGSWKDTKQQQIHGAMGELNAALDVIKVRQMDAAWTLNRQEKYFTVFGNKLDSTDTKINQQRHIISSIISKS